MKVDPKLGRGEGQSLFEVNNGEHRHVEAALHILFSEIISVWVFQ